MNKKKLNKKEAEKLKNMLLGKQYKEVMSHIDLKKDMNYALILTKAAQHNFNKRKFESWRKKLPPELIVATKKMNKDGILPTLNQISKLLKRRGSKDEREFLADTFMEIMKNNFINWGLPFVKDLTFKAYCK